MSNSHDLDIEISTEFLNQESDPNQQRFLFSYTITITNLGEQSIRLLDRYWRITDANDKVQEVHGEGVVGQQPEIPAGESFRYSSGALLETAFGTMEGYYGLITEQGEMFNANIPPFTLADPGQLH